MFARLAAFILCLTATVFFAAEPVHARGGSRSGGGGISRPSSPSPSRSAPSRPSTPSRSSPAPSRPSTPSRNVSRPSTPSRSSPAPSRPSMPSREVSRPSTPSRDVSRSSAPSRSIAPSRQTPVSRPSESIVRPARPDSSRLAEPASRRVREAARDNVSPVRDNVRLGSGRDRTADTSRNQRPNRADSKLPVDRPARTVIERDNAVSRYSENLSGNRTLRGNTNGPSGGGISERSTLGVNNSFRTTSASPNEAVTTSVAGAIVTPGFSGVQVSTSSFSLSVGTLGAFYYSAPSYYYGFSCSPFGVGLPYSHYYAGSYAQAYLVGTAWHIQPYRGGYFVQPRSYNLGFCGYPGTFSWGYYRGGCHYRPWSYCYRGFHTFGCGPSYCRVYRPYWWGCPTWYAYYPYSYGFYRYVYDRLEFYDDDYYDLDEDDYEDGYDKGYKRGYEDGAEDASAYKDDRRRDRIGAPPKARTPDPDKDRGYTDANTELDYEVGRGNRAFRQGDYDAAVKAYKEAVILEPSDAGAKVNLARAAFAAGKYSFGAFAVRRAVSADAKALEAVADLRDAYHDESVFKAHLKALNDEAAKNPNDADLQLLLGFVLLNSGDAKAAAAPLEAALKANAQDAAAKALYAQALSRAEGK